MLRSSIAVRLVVSGMALATHQVTPAQTTAGTPSTPAAPAPPGPASADAPPIDVQTEAPAGANEQDIVVTATRREETLSRVPISISAVSQQVLDQRGIRQIDDLARITPGVNFSREAFGAGNRSQISIRGIESSVGASTTGVYIDDTPIQTRNAGNTSTNAFPAIFDLSRVEALRGPQGTLFGSGSEGGTIRFIAPSPGLQEHSGYARAELGFTKTGDPSYEAGSAVGGPLIEGKLGFRGSIYARHDGGWVDRVDRNTGRTLDPDANSARTVVARLALTAVPIEGLEITPSVFYQDMDTQGTAQFWVPLSDPKRGVFRSGDRSSAPSSDRFVLSALKIDYQIGGVGLHSNTAYFDRRSDARPDFTQYVRAVSTGLPYAKIPGEFAFANYDTSQKAFTQEVRLDGDLATLGVNWTVGLFYSHSRQSDDQTTPSPFFPQVIQEEYGASYLDLFGGVPLAADGSVFSDRQRSVDEQIAGFAQVDYAITERLKATVGARYSKVDFSFRSANEGTFAGIAAASGRKSESPFTPKLGLSFQADPRNLFYVSAAKGFRPGGAQRRPGAACAADLAVLGVSSAPDTYGSDNVWSYEAGAKNRVFGNRLGVSSSAFLTNWNDIQQTIFLPVCGSSIITNLGKARIKGFDVALDGNLGALSLSGAVAYTHAVYTQTITSGPALIAVRDNAISTISPWSVTATANYGFDLFGRDGYARLDYDYRSSAPRVDGDVFGVDPVLFRRPASHVVNSRVGVKINGVDVSIFAQNLLDNHKLRSLTRDVVSSPLFYGATIRPRTIGVTLAVRR